MTQSKKQLDELFGSVANDTPSLEANELLTLLENKTTGNLGLRPSQILTTKEDRKRGFLYKGVFIMTLIAIAITALLFYHESSPVVTPEIAVSNPGSNSNSESRIVKEEKPSQSLLTK